MILKKQIAIILCLIAVQSSFGSNIHPGGTRLIDSYLKQQQFAKADSVLQQQLAILKSGQQTDSLIDYIYYIGKVNLKLSDARQATLAVSKFADEIKSLASEAHSLRQLYIELGSFYNMIGKPKKAYESDLEALSYTSKMQNATGEDFGIIHSNMGSFARFFGDLHLSLQHHRKALAYYKSYPGTTKVSLYITYNSLGGMMWYASKIDSALFFYQMADSTLRNYRKHPSINTSGRRC
jgi:tetratricopeptide (TPR) repeat protein